MSQTSETKYEEGREYLESLQNLGEHIKASRDEMLKIINDGGDYETRFDIKIEMNGKSAVIELHADSYDRIMSVIEAEIKEFIELEMILDEQ